MRSTKKVVSIVMAVACLMALSIPAFAADTTVADGTAVCADLYIPMNIHNIRNIDAHLTDASVPPTTAPSANNTTVNVVNGKMQVTIDLPNTVFVIEESNKDAIEAGSITSTDGGARIVGATWVADSYRSNTNRASSITIEFNSLDTTYVFQGVEEYGNSHPFVVLAGGTGSHTFDLYFTVTQK